MTYEELMRTSDLLFRFYTAMCRLAGVPREPNCAPTIDYSEEVSELQAVAQEVLDALNKHTNGSENDLRLMDHAQWSIDHPDPSGAYARISVGDMNEKISSFMNRLANESGVLA